MANDDAPSHVRYAADRIADTVPEASAVHIRPDISMVSHLGYSTRTAAAYYQRRDGALRMIAIHIDAEESTARALMLLSDMLRAAAKDCL